MNLEGVLEGLLFIVGSDGIEKKDAMTILEVDENKLNTIISNLQNTYKSDNRGIKLETLGNKLKLTTKKEYSNYYKKLVDEQVIDILSQATLETLAIIAYNRPITRSKVDEIRGVSSSHIIRKLLAMNFIKEVGKSPLPGHPNLYDITSDFLDYFGLSSIDNLPKIEVEEKIDEEKDLFTSRYSEENI